MPKLIVTTSDSGAGAVKQARLADRVQGLNYSLVTAATPKVDDPLSFFEQRQKLSTYAEDWESEVDTDAAEACQALAASARDYDIELWIDPTPNGQLILLQLLNWWTSAPWSDRPLSLFQASKELGWCAPEELAAARPEARPVTAEALKAASLAWSAYCRPTPDIWNEVMRSADLIELPFLKNAGTRLLAELPAAGTSLMHTQTQILTAIENGTTRPLDVFSAIRDDAVYSYWTFGHLLDELATCSVPALTGLREGPFSLELHDDAQRFDNFKRSSLRATEFGQALLAGQADFAAANRVHRWWGGTLLTNQNLWRWDARSSTVVRPSN